MLKVSCGEPSMNSFILLSPRCQAFTKLPPVVDVLDQALCNLNNPQHLLSMGSTIASPPAMPRLLCRWPLSISLRPQRDSLSVTNIKLSLLSPGSPGSYRATFPFPVQHRCGSWTGQGEARPKKYPWRKMQFGKARLSSLMSPRRFFPEPKPGVFDLHALRCLIL